MNNAAKATKGSFAQYLRVIMAIAIKTMAQGKLYYLNLNPINPEANNRK